MELEHTDLRYNPDPDRLLDLSERKRFSKIEKTQENDDQFGHINSNNDIRYNSTR